MFGPGVMIFLPGVLIKLSRVNHYYGTGYGHSDFYLSPTIFIQFIIEAKGIFVLNIPNFHKTFLRYNIHKHVSICTKVIIAVLFS